MAELTYTIQATQDTYWGSSVFQSGQPNSAFLYTGRIGAGAFTSIIDFSETAVQDFLNLSNVTSTDNIVKAELHLNLTSNAQSGVNNPLLGVKRIAFAWLEATANLSNQPPTVETDSFTLTTNPTGSANKLSKFDITNIVKGWINSDYNCYGVQIQGTSRDSNSFVRFQSSGATMTQYRPRLVITYTEDEEEGDGNNTHEITANGDTFSRVDRPDETFYTDGTITCGGNSGSYRIAYIAFNQDEVQSFLGLGDVNSVDQIVKAELVMTIPQSSYSTNRTNALIQSKRITEAWTEQNLTFDNSPATTTDDSFIHTGNPFPEIPDTEIFYDITNIVKGWVGGDYPCYGISLEGTVFLQSSAGRYASLGNGVSNPPTIRITYTPSELSLIHISEPTRPY